MTFGSDERVVTAFTMFFLVTVYFIPLIVMVVTYSRILAAIIKQTQFRQQQNGAGGENEVATATIARSSTTPPLSSSSSPGAGSQIRHNPTRGGGCRDSIPMIEINNVVTSPSGCAEPPSGGTPTSAVPSAISSALGSPSPMSNGTSPVTAPLYGRRNRAQRVLSLNDGMLSSVPPQVKVMEIRYL